MDHPNTCAECGYILKKTEEIAKDKQEERKEANENASDVNRKWRIENPFVAILEHLDTVFFILSGIFIAIAIIKLHNWNSNLSDVNVFLKTETIRKSVNTLFIFFVIFITAENIFDSIWTTLSCTMLSNWAGMRKINLITTIKTSFFRREQKMDKKERECLEKDLKFTLNAAFMKDEYLIKNKRIIDHVVNAIAIIIADIFVCSFVFENVKVFMQAQMLKSDMLNISGWELAVVESWWKLAVGVVIIIAMNFYGKYSLSNMRHQREEWLKKTMPEHKGRYKNLSQGSEF